MAVMIDGIQVETAELRRGADQMRRFGNDVYDVLTAAQQKMRDMQTNGIWLSSAGQLIIDRFNALYPQIDRKREVINEYCDFLIQTADRYAEEERRLVFEASQVGPNPRGL